MTVLPLILQHVRELADVHSSPAERDRYKIITPFPPIGQDFPDFDETALEFADPPKDGDAASIDTNRAFEFFNRTDSLYFDYSYGIRSEDHLLSGVCQRFYLNAKFDTDNANFTTAFREKSDAFLNRYIRSTAGDLGRFDFRYTSHSPVSWDAERVVLNASEVVRLTAKAIQVYEDLELDDPGFVAALIGGLRESNYSEVSYNFGYFDVYRAWVDAQLFDNPSWSFSDGTRILYGENNPYFAENEARLCFAQRFYLVRNYGGKEGSAPAPKPPTVRDHSPGRLILRGRLGAHARLGNPLIEGSEDLVAQKRRMLRNSLIGQRVARMETRPALVTAAPRASEAPFREGYVWVTASETVPGHWERARAGAPPAPDPPSASAFHGYKVAAVKCRVIPSGHVRH